METIKICGIEYVTNSALSGGDYGGAGYLAHVNCEVLQKAAEEFGHGDNIMGSGFNDWNLERDVQDELDRECDAPVLIMQSGGYNSVAALVRADVEELVEMVASLDDYPVLDDEALSEREMEIEAEAWIDYTAGEVRDFVEDAVEDDADEAFVERVEEFLEQVDGDLFHEWFLEGSCECNVYPEFEGGGTVYYRGLDEIGAYIYAEYVKPAVEALILDEIDSPAAAILRAIRDERILPLFSEV